MQKIVLEIASIKIQIQSEIDGILNRFKEFYKSFILVDSLVTVDHTIDVIIENFHVKSDNVNNKGFRFQGYGYKTKKNESILLIPSIKNAYQYVEEFLLFLFSQLCINKSKLIFHSATLIDEKNNAYIFFGPSGVGKTTISKKLCDYKVFSDDMVVLEKREESFIIHKTPFERAKIYKPPIKVNIKGFYRLVQSEITKKKTLDKGSSFNCFLSNLWFENYHKNNLEPYLKVLKNFTSDISVFELHTNKLTTQKEIINILKTNEKN